MRATVLSVLLLVMVVYGGTLNGKLKREVNRCYQGNEVFTDCGPSCPKTCDSVLQTAPLLFCPALCVPGCFCKEGYVRNRWGNCIPLDQCPCHGQNEVFVCGSACQTACNTLDQICPDQKQECKHLCQCRDGFARDNSGACIPISSCFGNNL